MNNTKLNEPLHLWYITPLSLFKKKKMIKRVVPLLLFLHLVQCFYLPGVAPHNYLPGEKVDLNVNSIQSVISYDYYHERLHLCAPKVKQQQSESIGSVLFGDRIFNSPFEVI
jgi:transmembrane 9 superfamily protein 2/4